jgi:predicted 3-demethylubiquinone-9 3-methyltransferase (glyoxalase superfamily)
MSNKIYPCLWFDGKGKEAAELYCTVFENSKIVADTGLVQIFELNGKKFMALNGGPMFTINPSISFFVSCKTAAEIETKWKQLSEGGMVMMPLNSYPWSEKYGWCQDKYGVNWQLTMPLSSQEISSLDNLSIIPSLMFTQNKSGKANEAIDFYTSVFPNSATEMIARYEKGEPDVEGYIKHARFSLAGERFAIMDSSGPHMFTFSEGLSLVVDCADQEEVDYYWEKLTAGGGQESMCAWLKDKFGVSWQIVPIKLGELIGSPDREKAGRAMQAMLKMKKIIIADLQKAYDGI